MIETHFQFIVGCLDFLIDRSFGNGNSRRPIFANVTLRLGRFLPESNPRHRATLFRRWTAKKEYPQTAATECGQVQSTIIETNLQES